MLDENDGGSAQESLGSDRLTLVIPTPLDEVERAMILSTLEKTGGNKTQAAQLLKITKKTLYNKLHTYEASRHASPLKVWRREAKTRGGNLQGGSLPSEKEPAKPEMPPLERERSHPCPGSEGSKASRRTTDAHTRVTAYRRG